MSTRSRYRFDVKRALDEWDAPTRYGEEVADEIHDFLAQGQLSTEETVVLYFDRRTDERRRIPEEVFVLTDHRTLRILPVTDDLSSPSILVGLIAAIEVRASTIPLSTNSAAWIETLSAAEDGVPTAFEFLLDPDLVRPGETLEWVPMDLGPASEQWWGRWSSPELGG